MDWIAQNWIWMALVAAVALLYLRGNLFGRSRQRGAGDALLRFGAGPDADQKSAMAPQAQANESALAQHRHHGCC